MQNAEVTDFVSKYARPRCQSIRAMVANMRAWLSRYGISGGVGDIVYAAAVQNPTEAIDDGRAAEGVHQVNVNDVLELRTLITDALAVLDRTGAAALIEAFCVTEFRAQE